MDKPILYPNTNGLVERTLNVSDILELTRHSLNGETIKKVPYKVILDGKETITSRDEWVKVAPAFMTTEGVETIISELQLLANHVTMGSNLPEEIAREMAYNTDLSIISALSRNSFKWRIDISKLRMLDEVLRNIVYSLIYRSVDGWLMEKLTTMTSRTEENSNIPQQQKSIGHMINPMRLFR